MSNFQFGTSKDTIQDTSGAPRMANPFLGKVKLAGLPEVRTIKAKDGTEYPNILAFTFKAQPGETDVADNEVGGFLLEKLEWPPRDEDSQDKVSNKTGRIGYIMSKFLPEEDALIDPSQIKSWEHFIDTVINRFEKNPDCLNNVVRIKAPASEYKGKVDFDIPNYKGFIQASKEDNPLAFSKKETAANNKWLATQSMEADNAPDEDGVNLNFSDDDDLF
jgi:hypothetical protein